MRTLIVIPISHSEKDMGSGEQFSSTDEVWSAIRRMIADLELP